VLLLLVVLMLLLLVLLPLAGMLVPGTRCTVEGGVPIMLGGLHGV